MLTIKKSQFEQLDLIKQDAFINEIKESLKIDFPNFSSNNPKAAERLLIKLYVKAISYNLSTEKTVASFIYYAMQMGNDFDTIFPAIHLILIDPLFTQDEKCEQIDELIDTIFTLFED